MATPCDRPQRKKSSTACSATGDHSGLSIQSVPTGSFGGAAADFVTAGLMDDCRSFPGADYQINWRDELNRFTAKYVFFRKISIERPIVRRISAFKKIL